ncbi:ATP/GTP-binding protein [Gryllotalpicola reticulitermitis]|uniref:ATP/GTP-binding protein n=1 Tax=Gryllotalpicola reticulitermitis TaxID=1184153 RepID=A0ABV8QAA4_9MICO
MSSETRGRRDRRRSADRELDTQVSKTPLLAKIPVLKLFISPDSLPAPTGAGLLETTVSGRPVDVPPWNFPGTRLRASGRHAARGWYAPALPGAPSTTRQAEVLNTAIVAAPTGTEGVVQGRDNLSRTLIAHDPATAYNTEPRQITSPNVLIFGTVGAGKSSLAKTNYVLRPLTLYHRRAVVYDKKADEDHGEYTDLALQLGSTPLMFNGDGTGTRLNMLDPNIIRAQGLQGQTLLLSTVAQIARNDTPATEWEAKAIRHAVVQTLTRFQDGRVATPNDLLPYLGEVPNDDDLSPESKERLHQAGLSVRFALEGLLEEYSGLLDGETSRDVDLNHKLTVFDLSGLPDTGPAVPAVMAIGNMWLTGRLRRDRGYFTNVLYEEGWHLVDGPAARVVKAGEKLSRALGISTVFLMHKGTDIPAGSPGYTVVQEAQTVHIFRQDRPEDAAWAVRTFNLDPASEEILMNLQPGHHLFKMGSNPEVHVQHIRSQWEAAVTNTDGAIAQVAR